LERGEKAMKVSKFSFAQKAFILKQGDDGVPVAEICRNAGISQGDLFQLTQDVCWAATRRTLPIVGSGR
jgi:putative transposase